MISGFRLNFAPHLGFPTPDSPLFGALVGDVSPKAQIAFAAQQGFRCVQDPFAAQRSEAEQVEVGDAAKAAGLGLGCFVFAPMQRAMQPIWSAIAPESRRAVAAELDAAIAIGRRIGSRHIAVLTGSDPGRTKTEQLHAFAANLASVADQAARAGMILCIEAVNAQRLPQMLLHYLDDAIAVVRDVAHPNVRLIFDTAHVEAMDGDILQNLDKCWDMIELVQLADHPGRVEPGSGQIDFETFLDELDRRQFAGPVELEHLWADADVDRQLRYLQWLDRWAVSGERIQNGSLLA